MEYAELIKLIADNGFMVVFAGVMLYMIKRREDRTAKMMQDMIHQFTERYDKMIEKQEGAYMFETPMEQIRVLQSAMFDLAKHEVLSHLQRIFSENHLQDRDQVKTKIHDVLVNVHNDRNSKLDNFKYHGIPLSKFTDQKWIDRIADVCLKQIYINEKELNARRAFAALDIAYNHIKAEFYNNIITKS